jgi:hypothetical protein
LGVGYAHYWAGQYDDAAERFDLAATTWSSGPLWDDARYAAAIARWRSGQKAEAQAALRQLASGSVGRTEEPVSLALLRLDRAALLRDGLARYRRAPLRAPEENVAALLDHDGGMLAGAALERLVDAPSSAARAPLLETEPSPASVVPATAVALALAGLGAYRLGYVLAPLCLSLLWSLPVGLAVGWLSSRRPAAAAAVVSGVWAVSLIVDQARTGQSLPQLALRTILLSLASLALARLALATSTAIARLPVHGRRGVGVVAAALLIAGMVIVAPEGRRATTGGTGPCPSTETPAEKPNLLLVTIDALCADAAQTMKVQALRTENAAPSAIRSATSSASAAEEPERRVGNPRQVR